MTRTKRWYILFITFCYKFDLTAWFYEFWLANSFRVDSYNTTTFFWSNVILFSSSAAVFLLVDSHRQHYHVIKGEISRNNIVIVSEANNTNRDEKRFLSWNARVRAPTGEEFSRASIHLQGNPIFRSSVILISPFNLDVLGAWYVDLSNPNNSFGQTAIYRIHLEEHRLDSNLAMWFSLAAWIFWGWFNWKVNAGKPIFIIKRINS